MSNPLSGSMRPTASSSRSPSGRPSSARAAALSRGAELLQVHAERDHGYARPGNPEHLPQQLPLMLCGRDDAVDRVHQPALRLQPLGRLALGGAGAQLHLAQGVEHRQVRHAPPGRQPLARDHGQPVVRVHQVVAQPLASPERLHPGGELCRQRDHLLVLELLGGTGRNMHQPGAGAQLDDLGRRRVVSPREHVGGDAVAAELRRDAADIVIHPAGLAAAERRQRRGVEREHRDAVGELRHGLAQCDLRSILERPVLTLRMSILAGGSGPGTPGAC